MAFNIRFNGVNIPSYVKVTAVSYAALPELQHNFSSKTSGVGLVDNGTQILGKTISVSFTIIPTDKSILQLTQDFAKWLVGDNFNLSTLEVTDGETFTYQAKVNNSVEIADDLQTGSGTIEFIVPTGVAEGSNAGVSVSGNKITVNYTGSAISYPVVQLDVTAPTSTVSISDPDTGRRVTVYGSFRAGDTVIIDCRNKRVRINGYINMKNVAIDSTWITYYREGTYTINCTGTGTWSCRVPLRYY